MTHSAEKRTSVSSHLSCCLRERMTSPIISSVCVTMPGSVRLRNPSAHHADSLGAQTGVLAGMRGKRVAVTEARREGANRVRSSWRRPGTASGTLETVGTEKTVAASTRRPAQ